MAKHYLNLSKILKRLLYERRVNPSELAREANLPTTTIHRIVTGKSTRPYRSSLKPIADYLSVSVEQLLGEAPLPNDENKIQQVPLIPLEQFTQGIPAFTDELKKIPIIGTVGQKGFAVVLNDSSMKSAFPRGSILVFDPEKNPQDRSFVLVKLHTAEQPIFRKLLVDAEQRFIKSLNPDLNEFQIRVLNKKDTILATLVESRTDYRNIDE